MATAIFRSERFADGSIATALEDGTLRAVLGRLRRWFEHEHRAAEHGQSPQLSGDETRADKGAASAEDRPA
jgi:hypothetical protein